MMNRASIVKRFYAALNRHDLEALAGLLAPDVVHHGLPPGDPFAALETMLTRYRSGFPDLRHRIDALVEQDDTVAVRITTSGTHQGRFLDHPPSGLTFTTTGMGFYALRDGRIGTIWEVFDTLGMLRQLRLYAPAVDPAPRRPKPPRRREPRLPGPATPIALATARADPLAFLSGLVADFGDIVRYTCEGRDTILINKPKAVRHVLHDRADLYTKTSTPDLQLLKPMLGDGLLTTDGAVWRQDRDHLQPGFTSQRMTARADLMIATIERTVDRWGSGPDATVDIVQEMSRLTLEAAAQVLFSSEVASRSEQFGEAMAVLNETMGQANTASGGTAAGFAEALALIRRTVWQLIVARRFHDGDEDDLLALLLRMQRERGDGDAQVIDQAVTILLAGHETTAKALAWAVALLNDHPEGLATLLAEVDLLPNRRLKAIDLASLPYTRAVIDEALRLDPPIWLLTRAALADDRIDGYAVPAGTLVAVSPYLLHRHPAIWDDPGHFRPERFMTGLAPAQRHSYLPFGDGPRHCIGKFFAMLEMPLVLATLFRRYAVEPLWSGMPEREALVTLRPRGDLLMRLRPRIALDRRSA